MKKAPKKKSDRRLFEEYCLKEYTYIQKHIWADDFEIRVAFDYTCATADKEIRAETMYNYTYRTLYVRIYLPSFNNWKTNKRVDVLETLLHEFCHHFTLPITEIISGDNKKSEMLNIYEERATEALTKNLFRLLYDCKGKHRL